MRGYELAQEAGVHPSVLSRIKNGQVRPTMAAVRGIERATKGKVTMRHMMEVWIKAQSKKY
jgi:DNA-binding transcriptional regulator YdaS (Cro superfamily)